jgi:flagellar protein FlaF
VIATSLARVAYAAAAPVRTPRDTEIIAFETITARLVRASAADAPMPLRAEAIHANRMLWTALATDIATPDNGLPRDLRARLLYLAEFSLLQSRAALRNPEALAGLIDVNRAVMRGLAGATGAP